MRLFGLVLAVALAACGVSDSVPTATPQPLAVPELKYRVMDELGRPLFCDPDFYPVARADERELAQQRLPEIQKDTDTFTAIVAYLKLPSAPPYPADQQLAIYREWKTLNAIQLQPINDIWAFAYVAQKIGAGAERVDGRVSVYGRVTVINRQAQAGSPPCPICLALGTRIATPGGDVAVQDLRIGDAVWTVDANRALVSAPLIDLGRTPVPATHQVVRLALDDGRVVFVSPGHPTAEGRRVSELATGDLFDGALVASAERVAYDGGATYDILPAGTTGAYWANGVLLESTLRAQ